MEDENSVGDVYKLCQVGGYHDYDGALIRQLAHIAVQLRLYAHVDTGCGFVKKQNLGVTAEPAASNDFLLVSAGEVLYRQALNGGTYVIIFYCLYGMCIFLL